MPGSLLGLLNQNLLLVTLWLKWCGCLMSASLHTRHHPWDCVHIVLFGVFLAIPRGPCRTSLTRDWTHALGSGSVESQPLDHQGGPHPWDWILDLFYSRLLDLICWSHQARNHSGCFSFVNLKLSNKTWKMKVGTAVGGESETFPLGLLRDETTNQLKNHREISQSDKMTLTTWRIKSHMIISIDTKKMHLTKLNIHL